MFTSINKSLTKNLIHSSLLILSIACVATAQAVGSSRAIPGGDGVNTIQGRVYFPPGEQKGKAIKLHLESYNSIAGQSAVSDQDGVFRFNNLTPGAYTVVVDGGKEYENTRESVTIEAFGGARIAQVNIQLRPKIDASNAAFAGVPQSTLDLYQKGSAAAQKGDAKAAAEFLSQAVASSPNFAMALSDLGAQYLKLLQWSKAEETYDALLKLKPDDVGGQLNLGIALYNQGIELMGEKKFEDAEKKFNGSEAHLREAIRLKSSGPAAHYYLGMMLIKFKAYDEAQKELELAISNGGEGLALAHRSLAGVYVNNHKNKEAADELEKYLKLEPKAPDADKIKASIKDLRSKP
jgi:tetratricopeptide (TPR) repeat protein